MVANTYKTAWEGDCSPHAGRCVPGSCCPHSAEMLLLRSRRGPRDLLPWLAHGYRFIATLAEQISPLPWFYAGETSLGAAASRRPRKAGEEHLRSEAALACEV